jgi:hypothetical protein
MAHLTVFQESKLAVHPQSQSLNKGIHFTSAYHFQLGFLDHKQQSFLCQMMTLKQTWEVITFPQLGDHQFNLSNSSLPGTLPDAITVGASL